MSKSVAETLRQDPKTALTMDLWAILDDGTLPDVNDDVREAARVIVARNKTMRDALTKAAARFRAYALMHSIKGTEDGRAKEAVNRDMAIMCEGALK